LHDEVAAEPLVAQVIRGDHGAVLGDLRHPGQERTDKREPDHPVRPSRGKTLAVVAAGGVADKQSGFLSDDLVAEAKQDLEDVVGAPQRRGCGRLPHPPQVGIDAPKTAVRAEGGLEACLGLAVVDASAVQDQHGLSLTVSM